MVPNRNAPKLAAAVCVISWALGCVLEQNGGLWGGLWLLGWEWRGWEGGFRCKPAGMSLPRGKGWGSVPRTPGIGQLMLLSLGSREDPPTAPTLGSCRHSPAGDPPGTVLSPP